MLIALRGWSAVLTLGCAFMFGTWLLWEATTDAIVLSLASEGTPRRDVEARLEQLERARLYLPRDDRLLRAIARHHISSSAANDDVHARLSSAKAALKAASAAAPLDGSLDYALGWLHFRTGSDLAAEERFLRALRKDPVNAEYRYGLGRLRERQGRIDEAVRAYRASLALTRLPKVAARLEFTLGATSEQEP